MATSDQKGDGVASMRIKLKYADEKSFVERFGAHVTRNGVFLATRTLKPTGTVIRFELLLADGTRVMRGEGVVAWKREPDPRAPQLAAGMGLKYTKLDGETRRLVERIAQQKAFRGEDTGTGVPQAPLLGMESSPVAIGGDTGPVASFSGTTGQMTAVVPPPDDAEEDDEDAMELRSLLDDESEAGEEVLERARKIAAAAAHGGEAEELDALLSPSANDELVANLETASQALADMLGAPAPRLERRQRERHKVAPVFAAPPVVVPVVPVVPAVSLVPPVREEAPPLEPPPLTRQPARRSTPPPPPPSRKRATGPMPFGEVPSQPLAFDFGGEPDRPVTTTGEVSPTRLAGVDAALGRPGLANVGDDDLGTEFGGEFGGGEATSISAGPALLRELLGHEPAVDEDSLPAVPEVTPAPVLRAGTESIEVNLDDDEGALLELDPDELEEDNEESTGVESPKREAAAIADLDAALDAALDLRVDGEDDK